MSDAEREKELAFLSVRLGLPIEREDGTLERFEMRNGRPVVVETRAKTQSIDFPNTSNEDRH